MTALALGAGESRMYAGNFAGVWRSDDGGLSWLQLTWPQPPAETLQADIPGALYAPHVFDIAASPADADVVLVCALDSQFSDGRDGIYRSADGGATWTLVLESISYPTTTPFHIVFAPDDPQLVYAVGTIVFSGVAEYSVVATSTTAGQTWSVAYLTTPAALWHLAVGPLEANGTRRIYAVGDSMIWYSSDGGQTWVADAGVETIKAARAQVAAFQTQCDPNADAVGGFGGQTAYYSGEAPQVLALEPGNPARVYLATPGAANGPSYYDPYVSDGTPVNTHCKRLAGEASLWVGDFSQFDPATGAQWSQLPGPPVYWGVTTPSGNCYVATKPTTSGFLLFFSDNSHLHVSVGAASSHASWHRLDGMDASVAKRAGYDSNTVFVHVDPHAIAFTSDFEITLKAPAGVAAPYNDNSELDQHVAGTLWLANDGGVYRCDDGGRDEQSWQMPAGLETIDPVNIAGLFGIGNTPALYFGCGDNNDFFTLNGGGAWGDPGSYCGDCDAWCSDVAQTQRVLQFLPRLGSGSSFEGYIGIVEGDGLAYPDASSVLAKTYIPSTKKINFDNPHALSPYAQSDVYLLGYRPLIQTLATETPLPDSDVVIIDQQLDGTARLLRTKAISSIVGAEQWNDPAKAQQIGPDLPPGAIVVQASGGHANPSYYLSDRLAASGGGAIWTLSEDQTQWIQIVPSSAVGSPPVYSALVWFVNPYDADELYVLDVQGMKVSPDGGQSWISDTALTNALTCGGMLSVSPSLLQDMEFSRFEGQTRFAMGTAGVFYTLDFGLNWYSALNSIALPGRPESGFFDPVSDPADRAIYVGCEARSVLRIGQLPASPPQASQPIDLMEFAALDY